MEEVFVEDVGTQVFAHVVLLNNMVRSLGLACGNDVRGGTRRRWYLYPSSQHLWMSRNRRHTPAQVYTSAQEVWDITRPIKGLASRTQIQHGAAWCDELFQWTQDRCFTANGDETCHDFPSFSHYHPSVFFILESKRSGIRSLLSVFLAPLIRPLSWMCRWRPCRCRCRHQKHLSGQASQTLIRRGWFGAPKCG